MTCVFYSVSHLPSPLLFSPLLLHPPLFSSILPSPFLFPSSLFTSFLLPLSLSLLPLPLFPSPYSLLPLLCFRCVLVLTLTSFLLPLPLSFLPPPSSVLQVCPSSDPLDSKDFNPIDYINQLFPTEQVTLSKVISSCAAFTYPFVTVFTYEVL